MKTILAILLPQLFIFIGFTQITDSRIITDSLHSDYMNERRDFLVYLPDSFNSQKQYPVIYCTDGQELLGKGYIVRLDSLISSKVIEPVVLIGLYSNEKTLGKSTTYRQVEYVKNFQSDSLSKQRFENHLKFFLKEAP